MVKKVYKILEIDGSKPAEKTEEVPNLKGKIIILNPEKSEIAKALEIKEKGIYSIKTV